MHAPGPHTVIHTVIVPSEGPDCDLAVLHVFLGQCNFPP